MNTDMASLEAKLLTGFCICVRGELLLSYLCSTVDNSSASAVRSGSKR